MSIIMGWSSLDWSLLDRYQMVRSDCPEVVVSVYSALSTFERLLSVKDGNGGPAILKIEAGRQRKVFDRLSKTSATLKVAAVSLLALSLTGVVALAQAPDASDEGFLVPSPQA